MKIDLYKELCFKLGKGVVWRMNPDDICDYIEKEYCLKQAKLTFDGKEDYIDVNKPADKIWKDELMYISEAVLREKLKLLKDRYADEWMEDKLKKDTVWSMIEDFKKELGLEDKK